MSVSVYITDVSERSDEYEINFNMSNWSVFARMLGLGFYCEVDSDDEVLPCGDIPVESIPMVRRNCILMLNSDISSYVRDPRNEGNFYESGISEEYLRRRIKDFHDLLVVAQSHNKSVYWI